MTSKLPPGISVIGLTGRAQAGKDTVADYLVREHGFTRFAFADKLKSMALVLDPIVQEGREGDFARLSEAVHYTGWEGAKKMPEVRRFLQVLGTEAVRDHLGPDTWVNAVKADAMRILSIGGRVVFSDVRFPNEADLVDTLGGEVWKVVRPQHEAADPNHASEANVDSMPAAMVFVNDSTIAMLLSLVQSALGETPK